MKDSNKRTEFEKYWEEVFQNAEMTPSDNLWNKIDSALSKEEAGYFKRKAFMFKLLAAASVVFALSIGIFSLNYYLQKDNQSAVVISVAPESTTENQEQVSPDDAIPEYSDGSAPGSAGETQRDDLTLGASTENTEGALNSSTDVLASGKDQIALVAAVEQSANGLMLLVAQEEENIVMNPETDNLSAFQMDELQPIELQYDGLSDMVYDIDHIFLIPIMPRGASKIKKESDTGILTASLDFSAGSFNPNFEQSSGSFVSMDGAALSDSRSELVSFNTANKNFLLMRNSGRETKSQIALSYGVNIGFKITNRFLIQTGLAYRKANTTTTANGYIENPDNNTRIPIVASYLYQFEGLSSVNSMEQTDLSNQYEFASIPLRAGYVLLDRKVNVTLLAGVSSEFFINNTIEDKSDFLQTLSSSDAADTPYQNLYFNGSIGTMIGYTFAGNYMMTIEPGYRMALSSFTKDNFYLNSFPSSFMLTFGLAYNFK